MLRSFMLIAPMSLLLGAAPPVRFVDLATPFELTAVATEGKPEAERVAAIRQAVDPLLPGVYRTGPAGDRRIAQALAAFPSQRAAYDRVIRSFPTDMEHSVERFRTLFPGFSPQFPIYLDHSLGARDGGTDVLQPGHRKVMLFGADMIAKLRADDSRIAFFDHELFHLENAKTFSDCGQLWCGLWQEGLAVAAAAAMTPGASDHQLLLDQPSPIRGRTDARLSPQAAPTSALLSASIRRRWSRI